MGRHMELPITGLRFGSSGISKAGTMRQDEEGLHGLMGHHQRWALGVELHKRFSLRMAYQR